MKQLFTGEGKFQAEELGEALRTAIDLDAAAQVLERAEAGRKIISADVRELARKAVDAAGRTIRKAAEKELKKELKKEQLKKACIIGFAVLGAAAACYGVYKALPAAFRKSGEDCEPETKEEEQD